MSKVGYVYILASPKYGTLYVGVTSNLHRRIEQHRDGCVEGFTKKHKIKRLVWFEEHQMIAQAISREKTIKGWPRQWKINAIEETNSNWNDLAKLLI